MNRAQRAISAATAAMALLTACASAPDKLSTGQFIDDRVISTRVKAALIEDPALPARQISVDTFNGTVQLSGFVASAEDIERAGQLARRVDGVKTVKNDIRLRR
jgi:hyperosmotically inducible protein